MVVRGAIDEVPPAVKENFARDCSTRLLYTKLLTDGLRNALMPHLAVGAAKGWLVKVSGNAVDISLKDRRNRGFLYDTLRYRIRLAEETGPDEFSSVPVREKDVEKLKHDIESWLCSPDGFAAAADEQPAFKSV